MKVEQTTNATANAGHRVWVGHVPSRICVNEGAVRDLFSAHGEITNIAIHHDFIDMTVDGFLFVTFTKKADAENAVSAVQAGSDGMAGMRAALALPRGDRIAFEVDKDIADLLLGRRQASAANPFSQHSQLDAADEDELMLQSLSQRAARRGTTGASITKDAKSKSKSKKKQKRYHEEE